MGSSLYAAFCPPPSPSLTKFSRWQPTSLLSCPRVACCSGSQPQYVASELKFALHDALESTGMDTTYAREAREGFWSQIKKLSSLERETSISINRCVDLGKTALHVAAEDDSLISHSSVPLPVDAFIDRLDDLSVGYCPHYSSSFKSSPESFLESIERYLFDEKVLTHRSGSAVMLSLIYSEILKMLRLWGLVDFDVEISFPLDLHSLPRGYQKQKSKESDQPHIMTVQTLLEEILSNLKTAFWPFQHDQSKSLFLRAARAANCIDRLNNEDSGLQLASAKAAQHRLERGVWTSVRFGDMRRALAACERLILLETDAKELRDYSILLYHCGLYEQSLQHLKKYQETKSCSVQKQSSDLVSRQEDDAVEKLMIRLNLIMMEQGWSKPSYVRNFLGNNSEPW
ncbi:Tetratricopeptide-like helical domain containing protein [Melia azedarach]|uniref:Tetratricopeptide-like helical domain containing protein n=1 Tax=Melia azedarach TaxID=155640 RepID=A0ACC1YCG4_MELAZ|nr:Tetratricopeptide-like helical domain containing protein [Melia azedarach]